MFYDEGGVDWYVDMICQCWIVIGFFEGVQFLVFDIVKVWCEVFVDQVEQCKNMIVGVVGIGEQFFDFQNCVMVEQVVEYIDGFVFGWVDWQDVVIVVLVGKFVIEF